MPVFAWRVCCTYVLSFFITAQTGDTPLIAAAFENHAHVVDILLAAGAQPNVSAEVCTLCYSENKRGRWRTGKERSVGGKERDSKWEGTGRGLI